MPIVFALGFANYPLICGLGAASVPIIIHLLNRRKYREMPWAAMRFLLAAIRKNSAADPDRAVAPAGRADALIILLVVTAMAKPFLESLGASPIMAGQRTHRVLVLDGSLSMAYATAGATRFEQAKTLAAQLVQGRPARRRHQRRPDGRPAPRRHRRPLAQPRRGAQGDRARSPCRTAGPT